MAKLITRVWKSTGPSGHQVKRLAADDTMRYEARQPGEGS